MKVRFILFILSAFFISFPVSSQVNSYLQNNPVWHITLNIYSGSDCVGYNDSYNYYTNGDTVVNAMVFKKVYRKGILSQLDYFCSPYNPVTYINTTPSFIIRSSGKKMFFCATGDTTSLLLYDFNLSVGDTLPDTYTHTSLSDGIFTVAAIDSLYTPFGYRKRFLLSGGDYLYEGAGSSGGLIESIFPLFLSGSHALDCYSLNDITYIPSTGTGCNMDLSVNSTGEEKKADLFPNPFNDFTTMHLYLALNNAELDIYTMYGEKIKSISHISGNEFIVRKENMIPGLYIYELRQKDIKITTGKLLITD